MIGKRNFCRRGTFFARFFAGGRGCWGCGEFEEGQVLGGVCGGADVGVWVLVLVWVGAGKEEFCG